MMDRHWWLCVALSLVMSLLPADGPANAQEENGTGQAETDAEDESRQDVAGAEVAGESDAEPAEAEWSPPETFDPLLEEFRTLLDEINESAGSAMAHLDEVRALREKVTSFNDQRQPGELSAAVEIQLLLWGNDYSPARDAAFARLDSIDVTNAGLRIIWAQHLKERAYKYERAIEVLDAGDIDVAKYPIAAVIRAEALVPQNLFAEAEAALDSIPPDSPLRADLLDRIYFQRQQLEELKEEWSVEAGLREADAAADDLPRVALETPRGTIVVELYENEAPNTVANFIQLIEQGFYNNSTFYQVVPNSFIAAGDPVVRVDEGVEGAPPAEKLNYQLPVELPKPPDEAGAEDETQPTGEAEPPGADAETVETDRPEDLIALPERSRDHFAGVLSMERAGENIDASRFIITLRRRADRDERNVAFGRVVEGMAIAREITGEDHIVSASVLRKRDHEYAARTIAIEVEGTTPPDEGAAEVGENAPEEADAGDEVADDDGAPPPDTSESDSGDGE
jgi:cyclophilin family peptidyl-prolyl cis-trans isomerase